jgi:hypothetical protein
MRVRLKKMSFQNPVTTLVKENSIFNRCHTILEKLWKMIFCTPLVWNKFWKTSASYAFFYLSIILSNDISFYFYFFFINSIFLLFSQNACIFHNYNLTIHSACSIDIPIYFNNFFSFFIEFQFIFIIIFKFE